MRRYSFDVVVVGAGPAGLAATASAAATGTEVAMVDDNPVLGGQIWRRSITLGPHPNSATLISKISQGGVNQLHRNRVIAAPRPGFLLAETPDGPHELGYRRLILAPGARELFLPFPGWTLPGVTGVGGLQALVKGGLSIKGKRVVVAGSGPLLLAVAAHLKEAGAQVLLIAEQASWARMAAFGLGLLRHIDKARQGAGYGRNLMGTPLYAGAWVTAAHGSGRLEGISLHRGATVQEIECDYLACAYGLVPNTELAAMLGCKISEGRVPVDRLQQTSVAGVYAAGEVTGIGGVDLSVVEGQIAGFAAAGQPEQALELFPARSRARHFAGALGRGFALRDELRHAPTDETIVCRCEDVRLGKLREYSGWRAAKLQTRCGMGPCQGRVCGPATTFLLGWQPDSVRPPLASARIDTFAQVGIELDS